MTELAKSPIRRILKKKSNKRVSKDATNQFIEELEEFAEQKAREINQFTEHANRKTVQADDVKSAFKDFKN